MKMSKFLIITICASALFVCSYYNGFTAGMKHGDVKIRYVEVEKQELERMFSGYEPTEEPKETATPSPTPTAKPKATATPAPAITPEPVAQNSDREAYSLGEFLVTAYCACSECCGKEPDHPQYGITASGTRVAEGRTIAVNPSVIPFGSHVMIDGHIYIAEDTGSSIKGNRIDIYIADHQRAQIHGKQYKNVSILKKGA